MHENNLSCKSKSKPLTASRRRTRAITGRDVKRYISAAGRGSAHIVTKKP